MKNKNRKRIEFSKIIMITAMTVNVLVIAFSCVVVWVTKDTSPLLYIIPAVAAEVATGSGFYYNKAKAENKLKIMKDNNIKPSSTDIDT